MTRRFALAPTQGLALVALAAVGFVLGAVQLGAACLVGPYNFVVEINRHVVDLARTLAGRWSGVHVPVPYLPPPSPPIPRPDGLYEHDGSLDKRQTMPRFLRRANWLAQDPATSRDWWWLVVNLPIGGALAALPAALLVGGLAIAAGVTGLAAWAAIPAGLVAAVVGVAIGPSVLRLHGWWTWLLLHPAGKATLPTFDGTHDVSSPVGGPTVVAMTLPCCAPGSPEPTESAEILDA
jgi:hypothetical protein